jgi:DNA processing protein
MSAEILPDEAWLSALASLPAMGPVRLTALLADRTPADAWDHVRAGAGGATASVAQRWVGAARQLDVAELWRAHQTQGVRVLAPGRAGWPAALVDDPEPPALLFARGEVDRIGSPAVAVIGTRHCTPSGRSVAYELGHDLAAAGVCVVSGLAAGIDAAAHEGALDVPHGRAPVAVVGTGVDVVYPRRSGRLWDAVAERGLIVSEYPLGTRPERWRFPARNRIIAGFADVVVVVESDVRGGSMHTVDAAIERGVTVLAVPGPVRSRASAGTNGLLAAGCAPARDAGDILVALGLEAGQRRVEVVPPPGDPGQVLDATGWEPSTLDDIAARLDAPLGPVAVHLVALERDGWIVHQSGWYTRVR